MTGDAEQGGFWPYQRQLFIAQAEANAKTGPALSARERAILELVAHGQSNKEIGRTLSISPETVKSHLENVYCRHQILLLGWPLGRARGHGRQ